MIFKSITLPLLFGLMVSAIDQADGQVVPKDLGAGKPAATKVDGVKLVPVKWAEYQKLVVPGEGQQFTLVDACNVVCTMQGELPACG